MQGIEPPGAIHQLRHRDAEWQGRLHGIPPFQFRGKQHLGQQRFRLDPSPIAAIATGDGFHVDRSPFLSSSRQHLGLFEPIVAPTRSVEHCVAEARRAETPLVFLLLFDDGDQTGNDHIRHDLALTGIWVSLGSHRAHFGRLLRLLRLHGTTTAATPRRLGGLRRVVGIEIERTVGDRPIADRFGLQCQDGNACNGPQVFNGENIRTASTGKFAEQRLVEHRLRLDGLDFW